MDRNETSISRDVRFCENQFPFAPTDQKITSDQGPFWEPNMVLENDFGPNENLAEMGQHQGMEEIRGSMYGMLGPVEGQAHIPYCILESMKRGGVQAVSQQHVK